MDMQLVICNFFQTHMASNEQLKEAFKNFKDVVIEHVRADSIISFLFDDGVLNDEDVQAMNSIASDKMKTRTLLAFLHDGQHPQAFSALLGAIKQTPEYKGITVEIDKFCDRERHKVPNIMQTSEARMGEYCRICHSSLLKFISLYISLRTSFLIQTALRVQLGRVRLYIFSGGGGVCAIRHLNAGLAVGS